ncbi:MAG: hypothetical protein M3R60_12935 [Pseudomonadota bacterium]|nr:hypothetical protein [Pseudomonadota bacterium]
MQTITAPVGENGTNAISDAALVQAILLKTRRPNGTAYLKSYDGLVGNITKGAIRDFQSDHVPTGPGVTAGLVKPADATWAKLLEQVDRDFADMRVLAGGKTVYIAATAAELQAKIAAVDTFTFTPAFRAKVIACIKRMHALHGIALGVCPKGDRRNFQTQFELFNQVPKVTGAGPGESNHNFGMAVDLGFAGLRWLRAEGAVTDNENPWLRRMNGETDNISDEAMRFWDAMRAVGTSAAVVAFRGPQADRPHLQNWDDAGVSMSSRLAAFLTSHGVMRWRASAAVYSCDLGLGGDPIPVGTAAQIWNRQATVTIAMLTQARANMAHSTAPSQGKAGAPGLPPGNVAITQANVIMMQQALRHQFDWADANWNDWTPH